MTPISRDDALIDELLAESELTDDASLRNMLVELRSFSIGAVPAPSAELEALMTPQPISLDAARRMKQRRVLVAAITVVAMMGAGATAAAAASPEVRNSAQQAITFLIHAVIPATNPDNFRPATPSSPHTPLPAGPALPTNIPGGKPSILPNGSPFPHPPITPPGKSKGHGIPPIFTPGDLHNTKVPTVPRSNGH